MKKYILFILLFNILCGALSAQSETTLRNGFFDNIHEAIPTNDGNILVLNQRSYTRFPDVYLMDAESFTRTQTVDLYNYIYLVEDMVASTDSSFFVIGQAGGCDYSREWYLIKFGSGGWVKDLGYLDRWYYGYNDNALQTGPNGGVWMNEGNGWSDDWVLYDNQGNEVPNGGGYNGIYNAWDLDDEQGAMTASGDFLLLSGSRVELYDNQLNLLKSEELGIDNYLFGNTESSPLVASDSSYIYILSSNDSKKLIKLDYDLQIINQINWNVGDDAQTMIADDDSLTVIGNDYHHTYRKKISKDLDTIDTNPDVGIVKILDADITNPSWGDYNIKNTKIIIQNYGTQPVFSYEINTLYHEGCGWYCEDDFITKINSYVGLLLPGEQDTVSFSDMNLCIDAELSSDLCFYITRPNSIVDRNHDNDRICTPFETFLPIELLVPLEAKIENQTVLLTWKTATETNNSGFEIQKSNGGINWNRIGWQDGQGTSFTSHAYTYIDENLLSGTSYYRFKQVDFDGKSSYSNVVSVSHEDRGIRVYPNPVKNALYFSDLNGREIQHIIIYDQTGRIALQTNDVQDSINVSALPTGVYIVEIATQGGVLYEKIMVE